MRKLRFALGAAVLLIVTCAKQEEPFQPLVLSAVQEGDDTALKTSLSGTSVHWSAADRVAAFVGITPHTSTDTEILSDTQARFTFSDLSAEETVSYAVYPASATVGYHEGGATVTVPSEQTAVADSFGEGTAVCIAKGDASPMVFRNICGFLAFTFKDADAANIASIRIGANEPMTGQADVHWNGGDPTVEPVATQSLNAVKLSGSFQSGKTYYVAVFPRTSYTGLTIKITHKDGYISSYSNPTPLTLARKGNLVIAKNLPLKTVPGSGNWAEKDPAYIGSSEVVIPVGKVGGNAYLISNAETDNAPVAASAPANLAEVGSGYKWNVSASGSIFQLYPSGLTERWLNCGTTSGSSNQNCMAVSNESYFNRKRFTWDAAGYVLTKDSYAARYLSYKSESGAWYGETFPASGTYPAASFSFYVLVP